MTTERFKWGADKTREFLALFKQGYTDEQLAEHFNASDRVIRNKRGKMGLYRFANNAKVQREYILANVGKQTVQEMAEGLQVCVSTIYSLLRFYKQKPLGERIRKHDRYIAYMRDNADKKSVSEMMAELGLSKARVYYWLRTYEKTRSK